MGAILPAVTLVLREADVERVIQMDAVIAAVEAAMRELGAGTAQNEPRRRAFAPGGLLNVMFASYPGGRCTGLKAYTVAAGRVRFLVVMFALDGSLQALIEADHMGAYRTGAATAVAVRALKPRLPATVALIGAGRQAATQALAISRVLEIKELRAFSRDPARRSAFAAEQSAKLGVRVVAAGSAEAAVRGSDVVITMTTSSVPVIETAWVEDHAVVVGAGSNFPNRTEIPADLVARARSVVVDQLAAAQLESGDLIQAKEAGKFDWDRATELASVLSGTWKAPDERGIRLFESHGLALWDIAAGSTVLPLAREQGLGEEIELF
ncbi:MAG TPA: ornithine cyclodeaminase family protein [Candidatus Dormibacteraeota bacterium]|jgi:ornithine cyclodeaminase/alanine dehydrogenase-like protein (mu-crystallin family)